MDWESEAKDMSEIPCECCGSEGDHPSRIICDACLQSAQGKAQCCIDTQAQNRRLKEEIDMAIAQIDEGDEGTAKMVLEQALKLNK